MSYVKWIAIILFWGFVALFLLYTLPQNDIARVTDTYEKRMDLGNNSMFWARPEAGSSSSTSRDVFFIQTRLANGDVMVYRNEDTGWGWPPMFKMNSADMQARARDLVSTAEAPRWVRVTYYGIRSNILSTYPNVIRLAAVDGPGASTLPITRIIGFVILGILSIWLYVRLRRLREETIEPFLDEVEERREAAQGRVRRWFNRLLGR